MKYLFRILENCVVFIAQISHYGKLTVLHKLILIVLQLVGGSLKNPTLRGESLRKTDIEGELPKKGGA